MPVRVQYSIEDLRKPEGIERVLRQFELAFTPAPIATPVPLNISDLVSRLAPVLRDQFQATGDAPLNLQSLLPSTSDGSVLEDTHANRLTLYSPTTYAIGTMFFETDRTVLYIVYNSSGTLVWRYSSGQYASTFANRPADLGTNDAGFLFYSTDTTTLYIWTGAAWSPATPPAGTLVYTAEAANFNAIAGNAYWITGNNVTATLPASPADNDFVILVSGASGITGTIVGRNGNNIMASASNMTIDVPEFQIKLVYRSATTDWRLAF